MSTRASSTAIPIALGSFLPYTAVGSLGPLAEIMVRYGYRCAVMYTSRFFLLPGLLLFDGVETVNMRASLLAHISLLRTAIDSSICGALVLRDIL